MTFFDQVYSSLFPKKAEKNKILVQELILRSDTYQSEYKSWCNSEEKDRMLHEISTSYTLKVRGVSQDPEVHLLNSQYANGIAISFGPSFESKQFRYLFDWLAEKVAEMGYKRSNGDVTIEQKPNFVETREKHYLKPVPGSELPINQRFGNILIEYILIDDRPSFIRLMANIYSDRSYLKAEKFEDLAKYLLQIGK